MVHIVHYDPAEHGGELNTACNGGVNSAQHITDICSR